LAEAHVEFQFMVAENKSAENS